MIRTPVRPGRGSKRKLQSPATPTTPAGKTDGQLLLITTWVSQATILYDAVVIGIHGIHVPTVVLKLEFTTWCTESITTTI